MLISLSAKLKVFLLATIAFGGLFQCTKDDEDKQDPCDNSIVYYEADIQPIFNAKCAFSGCHAGTDPKAGLDLSSYNNVIAGNVVTPSNPTTSLMHQRVTATGNKRMPPANPLSSENIALIEEWINQGAVNVSCP